MNLIKEYLAEVNGVDIFAIISMVIFILVFILMVIHTFSLRKAEVRDFSRLPLEDDAEGKSDKENELNE